MRDQPSVASDLDHCQFKMPGKCKFLNKWLEQQQYHAWLRNSPDIHKAHCKCCNKILTFSPWENRPSKVIWKVFLYLYFCHVWKNLKGGVKTVLGIIFLTGYRHFHLKKRKVKQGFIYENAQKKVLENCNFCPGKSLILLNRKVYEPCY